MCVRTPASRWAERVSQALGKGRVGATSPLRPSHVGSRGSWSRGGRCRREGRGRGTGIADLQPGPRPASEMALRLCPGDPGDTGSRVHSRGCRGAPSRDPGWQRATRKPHFGAPPTTSVHGRAQTLGLCGPVGLRWTRQTRTSVAELQGTSLTCQGMGISRAIHSTQNTGHLQIF